ncbi:MAG: FHA domain-containing protein [Lentisphaeria bacterium]|nr:FHA domain-containing protein [Lentisphaeria bacterium]
MKYQIRFTQGEIAGKCVPISQDKALTIGRSHSNELKLTAPDVSGRHVVLTLTPNGVVMDNLSSRVTMVDSTAVGTAERKALSAGQIVTMGSGTAFVLECLPDDAPTAPSLVTITDDEATNVNLKPTAAPKTPPPAASANDDEATNLNMKPVATPPAAKPPVPADDDLTIIPSKPMTPPPAAKPAASENDDMTIIPSKPATPPPKPAPKPAPTQKPAAAPKTAATPRPVAPPPPKAPAPKPVAPPPPIAPQPENNADSGLETVAMQTRMATPEELEFMKVKTQKKQTKRLTIAIVSVVVVLGLLAAAYRMFIYRPAEKMVSWPRDENGRMLANVASIASCPWKNDINLNYPELPNTKVEAGDSKVEINTFIGKYHDVPLRLVFEAFQNTASLGTDRTEDFNAWMQKQIQSDENWNFDTIRPIAFYGENHGIPYLCVPYSRTVNNESYCGYAVQIRFEDWTFILLKEVPTRERWHAEAFIEKIVFFGFSEKFERNHWEGMRDIQDGTVQSNLDEAKALLVRNSPSVWPKAYLLIRSALCKLKGQPSTDDALYNKAIDLLKDLRDAQINYFNAQKISYMQAAGTKDKKTMSRIRDKLQAVFPSEEDQRYHKIRQNKWE